MAADGPEATRLVDAFLDEIGRLYGTALPPHPAPAEDFVPPRGAWMLLADGPTPVAGGGVRAVAARTAEARRVYAVPEARGQGAGRVLLEALEGFCPGGGLRTGPARHGRPPARGARAVSQRGLPRDPRLQRERRRLVLVREVAVTTARRAEKSL